MRILLSLIVFLLCLSPLVSAQNAVSKLSKPDQELVRQAAKDSSTELPDGKQF